MCYGIFDKATTENTIAVLKKVFEEYRKLDETMTDHGTQFVASRKDSSKISMNSSNGTTMINRTHKPRF